MPACDSDACYVSSGLCGAITFGSGELDDNGYWEKPCVVCALSYRERAKKGEVAVVDVWPLPPDPLTLTQMIQVLETPLGGITTHPDPIVAEQRLKLHKSYSKLRSTNNYSRSDKKVKADIRNCSLRARVSWLKKQLNIRGE